MATSYVPDWTKSFASNAPLADVFVTYAVTEPEAGFLGITRSPSRATCPGDRRERRRWRKMGLHGCPAGRVTFTGLPGPAPLPARRRGSGQRGLPALDGLGTCLPARALPRTMDAQLRRAWTTRGERRQFGRRIGDFQAVSHRLATMKQRLESRRLLLYRACWSIDQGRADAATTAASSKVAVSEAAVANSLDAVQVFGASRLPGADGYRAAAARLGAGHDLLGTTEIQRELVAGVLGDRGAVRAGPVNPSDIFLASSSRGAAL